MQEESVLNIHIYNILTRSFSMSHYQPALLSITVTIRENAES